MSDRHVIKRLPSLFEENLNGHQECLGVEGEYYQTGDLLLIKEFDSEDFGRQWVFTGREIRATITDVFKARIMGNDLTLLGFEVIHIKEAA